MDTLVFSGGIRENAPTVPTRVCEGLDFLGIHIDDGQNTSSAGVISTNDSRFAVRVIRTDEEWMIAKTVCRVLSVTVGTENDHESNNG